MYVVIVIQRRKKKTMANAQKQEAKDYVENKISYAFGPDYINATGGKIYVYGKAKNGEKIPIAISLTCPTASSVPPQEAITDFDWSTPEEKPTENIKTTEISDQEKKAIEDLFNALSPVKKFTIDNF